jgi:anti-sigma factor RsiW
MKITRNVILDLLPLYLADEVSADTRAIVEKYLETDPELANVVKHSARIELSSDIPVPLTQDNKLRAYRKAKRLITLRTLILAGLISVALVITIFVFFFSSL